MEWIWVAIVAVVVVGFVLWGRYSYKKAGAKNSFDVETDEVLQREATVLQKEAVRQNFGHIQFPEHRIVYMVCFELDDAKKINLEVPQEMFDALTQGERASLITQGDILLAFGEHRPPMYQE